MTYIYPPELEVTLDDATTARDSTDIEPSDPEATTGGAPTGERQFAINPGDYTTPTISYAPGTHPTSPGGAEVVEVERALPYDEEAAGPGLPAAETTTLPGETPDGPDPKLATLAAWGGVLAALVLILNLTGVLDG